MKITNEALTTRQENPTTVYNDFFISELFLIVNTSF